MRKNELANSMSTGTEPDSLANLITNLNVAKCAAAESAYLQCVNYALTQLNLPNVAMYIDAGTFDFTLSLRYAKNGN
jgi:cellulase/cellobiase CelA1